jgi:hypothetical protein
MMSLVAAFNIPNDWQIPARAVCICYTIATIASITKATAPQLIGYFLELREFNSHALLGSALCNPEENLLSHNRAAGPELDRTRIAILDEEGCPDHLAPPRIKSPKAPVCGL